MSRRRRRKNREQGAISQPSTRSLATLPRLTPITVTLPRQLAKTTLRQVEDRRNHHPLGFFKPAKMLNGSPHHRLAVKNSTNKKNNPPRLPHVVRFAVPEKTVVCIRREQRKQVLFAKRKNGKGNRRPRRNWLSSISCKR